MLDSEFQCQCCWHVLPHGSVGGYIGIGNVATVCLSCYGIYASVGIAYPDRTFAERLDTARTIRALEELSPLEKGKLKKLIFLVRNNSPRAERLSRLAMDGDISFSQLLSII